MAAPRKKKAAAPRARAKRAPSRAVQDAQASSAEAEEAQASAAAVEASTGEPVREAAELAAEGLRWPPVAYWMKVAAGVVVVVALANMVRALSHILILIVISLILSVGLQPGVTWLSKKGMRRGFAVSVIFVTSLTVVVGFLALMTPIVVKQIGQLVQNGPDYLQRAQNKYKFFGDLNQRFQLIDKVQSLASTLPSTALSLVKSFTAFLFNAITVLILTLYFTTSLPRIEAWVARLLRRERREEFETILGESTALVGGYIVGNVIVSIFAGVFTFIALALIGIPYPAALAFWVALTDLIPTVGALLGAAACVLVALFAGVPKTLMTVAFFVVYQQIENYVIAPRVMTRTVEMSAAAVIVAVLVGGTLAGFPGALLALPAAAIIKVTFERLYLRDRIEAVRLADAADAALQTPRRRLRLRRSRSQ